MDLSKAFDRLHHQALFSALFTHGIDGRDVRVLEPLYREQVGAVSEDQQCPFRRGVRQGDALSSLLSHIAFDVGVSAWKGSSEHRGVSLALDRVTCLTDVGYADYLLILS